MGDTTGSDSREVKKYESTLPRTCTTVKRLIFGDLSWWICHRPKNLQIK